jgi:putative transposase
VKERTVTPARAATVASELSPRVERALGELAGAAGEGLLALSVGVGLGVMAELMAEEVDAVVGPKAGTIRSAAPCVMAARAVR